LACKFGTGGERWIGEKEIGLNICGQFTRLIKEPVLEVDDKFITVFTKKFLLHFTESDFGENQFYEFLLHHKLAYCKLAG
jgi:hypothetical protein